MVHKKEREKAKGTFTAQGFMRISLQISSAMPIPPLPLFKAVMADVFIPFEGC
jgi:hypothetical protein